MSASSTDAPGPVMQLHGIAKSYAGIPVLKDVGFSVARGQVVALMGENGAGKSTLKNILCGLVAPDTGDLVVNGKQLTKLTSEDASAMGIAAIHQELSLFPNLSIAENIHVGLGGLPTRMGLIDRKTMHAHALDLLGEFLERDFNPDQLVGALSLGERQLVEVAKALYRASSLLIFDEPTTSLSIRERRRLFDIVRRLKADGYAIIYITHFMEEVYELADAIVVLRDGMVVGQGLPKDLDSERLGALMAGRELASVNTLLSSSQTDYVATARTDIVLSARQLSDGKTLQDVSFDLHAGEVLGIAGLMGAGRTEVAHAIFGIGSSAGTVEVLGQPFTDRSPQASKARGLALVSEDRRADQVFVARSVRENLTSTILGELRGWGGAFSVRWQQQRAEAMAQQYAIRHPGLDAPMASLSGGNQQKCIIARWLATKPKICILDEPTKGIDVGAKAEIHLLISKLAAAGLGVLLISSDLPELLALSHRILVLHKGRVSGRVERADFDPGRVISMASRGASA